MITEADWAFVERMKNMPRFSDRPATSLAWCKAGDRIRLADGVTATVLVAASVSKYHSTPAEVLRDDMTKPVKYSASPKIGCPSVKIEVIG